MISTDFFLIRVLVSFVLKMIGLRREPNAPRTASVNKHFEKNKEATSTACKYRFMLLSSRHDFKRTVLLDKKSSEKVTLVEVWAIRASSSDFSD